MSNLIKLTSSPKRNAKKDIKMMKTKLYMNEITYEEGKAALILRITAVFTV